MRELVVILGFLFLNAKINRLHDKAITDVSDIADIVDELQDEYLPDNNSKIPVSSLELTDRAKNETFRVIE